MGKSKAIVEYKALPSPVERFLSGQKPNTRRSYLSACRKFVLASINGIDSAVTMTKGGKVPWREHLMQGENGSTELVEKKKGEGRQRFPFWLRAYPWKGLSAVRVKAILAGMKTAKNKPISAAAYNQYLTTVKGIVKECLLEMSEGDFNTYQDFMRLQQILALNGKTTRRGIGRYVEANEVEAIKAACKADKSAAGRRDEALLAIAYTVGPRVSEVGIFDLEDYDRTNKMLTVRGGKGGKDRRLPVADDVVPILDAWLKVRGDDPGSLFVRINKGGNLKIAKLSSTSLQAILKDRAKSAGLSVTKKHPLSFHDLRRSAVTNLIQHHGLDIAQTIAGHESPETTKRYDMAGDKRAIELARNMSW